MYKVHSIRKDAWRQIVKAYNNGEAEAKANVINSFFAALSSMVYMPLDHAAQVCRKCGCNGCKEQLLMIEAYQNIQDQIIDHLGKIGAETIVDDVNEYLSELGRKK